MDTIGQRVKYARERTGLKPVAFAKALGVGRAAISKIEADLTGTIALDTALAIQKLTGVSATWIHTGTGPIDQSPLRDAQIARIVVKLQGLPEDARRKIEGDIDYIASLQ